MFKCEVCNKIVPSSISAKRIVIQTRRAKYPFRKDANKFRVDGKLKTTDDKGGSGREIVKEALACPKCAGKHSRKTSEKP